MDSSSEGNLTRGGVKRGTQGSKSGYSTRLGFEVYGLGLNSNPMYSKNSHIRHKAPST